MAQQKHPLVSSLHSATSAIATGNRTKLGQSGFQTRASSNGTLATAQFLGDVPSSKKTVKDAVGTGGATDFYQVNLTDKSRLRVVFTNRSGATLTGSVLDAAGKVVLFKGKKQEVSLAANETKETLIRGANPGTYYLRVKGKAQGTNRYEINLFANRTGGPLPLPCSCGT
jgi:hypothetical protein